MLRCWLVESTTESALGQGEERALVWLLPGRQAERAGAEVDPGGCRGFVGTTSMRGDRIGGSTRSGALRVVLRALHMPVTIWVGNALKKRFGAPSSLYHCPLPYLGQCCRCCVLPQLCRMRTPPSGQRPRNDAMRPGNPFTHPSKAKKATPFNHGCSSHEVDQAQAWAIQTSAQLANQLPSQPGCRPACPRRTTRPFVPASADFAAWPPAPARNPVPPRLGLLRAHLSAY
mmetsp:Transcript_25984/g.77012  ORF Transcript_25984/g.77012 Transcript_25984/m.77012 type:complete len:230 (+) Transcript_25984:330-1019(+)